jgi:Holliday junction DNA helicase RuvA
MISQVSGKVATAKLTSVVLDVGGIGYEISVAPELASKVAVGESLTLYTSLVVREDSWKLFGYLDSHARDLFEELQGVTGVGPKVAHSLISVYPPDELQSIIGSGDQAALERVPGIGKKVASRILLELRERYNVGKSRGSKDGKWRDALHEALTSLGYTTKEADRTIDETLKNLESSPEKMDISELLRIALSYARSRR